MQVATKTPRFQQQKWPNTVTVLREVSGLLASRKSVGAAAAAAAAAASAFADACRLRRRLVV
ncbi:unnamed protein product [Ceratitis capitata]|uniref:(Mediterranean fruit fly) hypothetical protein n=1 Tax=Ceratitis capitata TaxID=7213 RepID=A0A811VGT1_CERCA|nr:unnamed protein product [Ceratitis capitata]